MSQASPYSNAALDRDDLRAAVAAGMVSEAQAASLLALAQERAGHRAARTARDEPFELFKGFNEIFIVVGLVILYVGWTAVTGLQMLGQMGAAGTTGLLYAVLGMGALALAARYFTLKRRMIAPSIALTIMFALTALQAGATGSWELGLNWQERAAFGFGAGTLAMLAWYAVFRIPFAIALVAIGTFASAGSLFILGGATVPDPRDLFLLSAEGPFALLTIVMGLIGFTVAMVFDMGDPHRVSLRSKAGFWLHVVSAPAIVNTVALTLFDSGAAGSRPLLLGFLALMALIAIIIDRRSFLVAGVGYVVALAFVVLESNAGTAILILGLALVLLGAQWERLRRALMRALPAFPGKTRLPPYDLLTKDPA